MGDRKFEVDETILILESPYTLKGKINNKNGIIVRDVGTGKNSYNNKEENLYEVEIDERTLVRHHNLFESEIGNINKLLIELE